MFSFKKKDTIKKVVDFCARLVRRDAAVQKDTIKKGGKFRLRHTTAGLPIVKNRIVFATNTFHYTCNPKYIYEALMAEDADIDAYWLVTDAEKVRDSYPAGTKLIELWTEECQKIVSTAHVWLNNGIVFSDHFDKAPGQVYIQTMHGSLGIKKLDNAISGRLAKGKKGERVVRREEKNTDIVFTNSEFEENVFRTVFWKETKMERIGHARTDILFEQDNRKLINQIRERLLAGYGIPLDMRIVLYAPTHRYRMKAEDIDIDYARLCMELSKRFGGKWCVALRFHDRSTSVYSEYKKIFEKGLIPTGDWEEIARTDSHEWTDKNTDPNAQYEYLVRAVYEEDPETHYSKIANIVPGDVPLDVPEITSFNVGAEGIEINWKPVEGAARYELIKFTRKEGPKILRTVGRLTSCIDKDMKTGITGYYSLRAVDNEGNTGAWDSEGLGAVYYTPPMEEPRHGKEGTYLEWEVRPRAKYYKVFRRIVCGIYDVMMYPDIQELMLVADAGISDYSSWMYDFVNTKKPGFLYTKDLDIYRERTGFAYPIEESPFKICMNNDELMEAVRTFDEKEYVREIDKFLEDKKSVDDGKSAGRAAKRILEIMRPSE